MFCLGVFVIGRKLSRVLVYWVWVLMFGGVESSCMFFSYWGFRSILGVRCLSVLIIFKFFYL